VKRIGQTLGGWIFLERFARMPSATADSAASKH